MWIALVVLFAKSDESNSLFYKEREERWRAIRSLVLGIKSGKAGREERVFSSMSTLKKSDLFFRSSLFRSFCKEWQERIPNPVLICPIVTMYRYSVHSMVILWQKYMQCEDLYSNFFRLNGPQTTWMAIWTFFQVKTTKNHLKFVPPTLYSISMVISLFTVQ